MIKQIEKLAARMFDFDKIWQMIKRLRVSSAPPHTHTHPLPIPPFHSLLHDMAQGKGFFTLEVHSSTTHEVMLQTRSCALSNPSRRRRQGLSLDRQERLKVFLKKKKKAVGEPWNSSSSPANTEFHVERPAICVFTLRKSLPVEACLTLEVLGRGDLVKVEG